MEERYGRHSPPPPREPDAKTLLEHFGLISEDAFAALLGVSVRTLKNRLRSKLPIFIKAGHPPSLCRGVRAGVPEAALVSLRLTTMQWPIEVM
jgi:hypothetical protein